MILNAQISKHGLYMPVTYLKRFQIEKDLEYLKTSQYLSKNEIKRIQIDKLSNLLNYSKKYVPFYKRILEKESINTSNCENVLNKLPFLTKKMIQTSPEDFLSNRKDLILSKKSTAGSTGEPFIVYKDNKALSLELSAAWRSYEWAGIGIGDRQARFWGVPLTRSDRAKAKLIDFVCNRKRCSSFGFNENKMRQYTKTLIKFKPIYFYGYVSMLREYALFFNKIKRNPPFNLKCIITTSELLNEKDKWLIRKTFNTNVFNEYGSGEIGSIAHECEKGSMHINCENLIVDIIKSSKKKCNYGDIGEIVVTELNNKAMPLIKYRTGDMASLSRNDCKCGRNLTILENLSGRFWDLIKHKDGRKFHPVIFLYIFEEAKLKNLGVRHYKIIQKDYENFDILIVPETRYQKTTEKFIIDRFKKVFDSDVDLRFILVDKIEREKSGKLRQVVGMVEN
jgi:phenylacetate-CoA ligase